MRTVDYATSMKYDDCNVLLLRVLPDLRFARHGLRRRLRVVELVATWSVRLFKRGMLGADVATSVANRSLCPCYMCLRVLLSRYPIGFM